MSRLPLGNPAPTTPCASLSQEVESVKTAVVDILNNTIWPQKSGGIAQEFVQSLIDPQSWNKIPRDSDETRMQLSVRDSLRDLVRTMESIRMRLEEAADRHGGNKNSIGDKIKSAFRSFDKKRCAAILEDCRNDFKAAAAALSLPPLSNDLNQFILPHSQAISVTVGDKTRIQAAAPIQIQHSTPPTGIPKDAGERGKWLGAMKTTFDVVEGVSGTIPVVGSYVGAVARVGKILVQTIQNMDSNEDICAELETHASQLSATLDTFHEWPAEEHREKMAASLDDAQRVLRDVRKTAGELNSMNPFKKALFSDGQAEALREQKEKLRTALEVTQLRVQLDTSKLVAELYDAEGPKEQRRLLDRLGDAEYGLRGTSIDSVTCLPETRVATLERIDTWVRSSNPENRVLWIRGMAGRGKSTVASTVANRWKTHAACAIFHFRRGQKALDNRLVCGLARQLGSGHLVPEVKNAIIRSISKNEDIGKGRLDEQFQTLLTGSLAQLQDSSPPVLLIVDALDECEDDKYPVEFVKLIDKHSTTLPPNVKFLLTTRPEAPLLRALEPRQWNVEDLDSISNVDEDIRKFLQRGLSEIGEEHQLKGEWPPASTLQPLVEMSQGLFQWAHTAIEYIRQGSPRRRLQELLKSPSICNGLDALYLRILGEAFNGVKTSPDRRDLFLRVLGTLVVAPYPISLNSLAYLFADHPIFTDSLPDERIEILRSEALGDLQSLVHVPRSSTDPAQLMHTSVRDLLVDGERCKGEPFRVKSASYHQYLAIKCIRLMNRDLTTNICHLSDLSKSNLDASVQELVQLHIHPGLQYCCRAWSLHLSGASAGAIAADQELTSEVVKLGEEKLLSWLEVMSVIGQTREAMVAARWVHLCLQQLPGQPPDESLTSKFSALRLWDDTTRFINTFYEPIDFGALQIYASALPACPRYTALWSQYGNMSRSRPVDFSMTWSSALWTKHCVGVQAIAFSPDGKVLNSATSTGQTAKWDAQTGAPVDELQYPTTRLVDAVAFSSDGSFIALSSANKVLICDSQTCFLEPVVGDSGQVCALAFSPNGKLLASASTDGTVRIWNAWSRISIGKPLRGHERAVYTVAFSPDGKVLASGSADCTLRMWNVQTGAPIGGPLKGHDSFVRAVAFTPDGKALASGSNDMTIRIWDTACSHPRLLLQAKLVL